MMAWRAHGDKGVGRLAAHHLVHGLTRCADPVQRRFPCARTHGGVAVQMQQAVLRRNLLKAAHVSLGMAANNLADLTAGGSFADKHLKGFCLQRPLDRQQSVRALWMAGAHIVQQATWMADKKGRQRASPGSRLNSCARNNAAAQPIP